MSEQVTSASTWRVTSASRKGSSHGDDAPNQDAVEFVAVRDGRGADVWVAAVSDGHGGRRYVRSDVGSSLAVGVAVSQVAAALREASEDLSFEALLRREVPELVSSWRSSVLGHLEAHPFTEAEGTRAGVGLADDPVVAYGATLLVVIVGDAGVGLAQIGDGDALIRTHGFATRPVPGDPRLVAGETTSLCLDTAVSDFRYAALPGSADPDLVLLASDGYGNSFADKDWWRAVVGDLAWFLTDHRFEDFVAQFPAWLGESAEVGGDDVSAVVIARSPLAVPPGEAPPVVVSPSAPRDPVPVPALVAAERPAPAGIVVEQLPTRLLEEPVTAPPATSAAPGGRSHRGVAVLMVVLVLVVVVAVAWFVLDGPGSRGGPSTPGPSQAPTPGVSTPGSPTHHRSGGTHTGNPGGNQGTGPGGHQGGKPGGTQGHHGSTKATSSTS